ncbi:MAG: hypothetical protein ACI92I_000952 [Acidimicrobiales bacterium]|jgi:hypothetical protein
MITKRAKKIGVVSIVSLVFACGIMVFVWMYINTEGERLQTQAREVADYNARTKTYTGLSQLINNTQEQRKELRSYVLTEEETIDFLSEIETIAQEQGVDLTTNSLKKAVEGDTFEDLLVSFSIEGSEKNVKKMLHIFETLPYHGHISKLSLRKEEENKVLVTKSDVELNISLLNYD